LPTLRPAVACLLLASASAAFSLAHAATVTVQDGKVLLQEDSGAWRVLTSSGVDEAAVLSPDGRRVAFIRATPSLSVDAGAGTLPGNELWLMNADGRGAKRLLRAHAGSKPQNTLAALESPQFSPDGRTLYFISAAWVTSGAVHALDLKMGRERFVVDGNSLEVLGSGPYAGNLLVSRHKYWLGGGSYDWVWLIKPSGAEIGAVGPDEDSVTTFKQTLAR
jgi:dipeptidyl aminopeptidase/acylaminoacyl peptidase